MQGIITVSKETLPSQQFIREEILPEKISQQLRLAPLYRAQLLGNLYHQKVNIVYRLKTGEVQQVETTVWSVEENYVVLKSGITIPVHAIVEVEL